MKYDPKLSKKIKTILTTNLQSLYFSMRNKFNDFNISHICFNKLVDSILLHGRKKLQISCVKNIMKYDRTLKKTLHTAVLYYKFVLSCYKCQIT